MNAKIFTSAPVRVMTFAVALLASLATATQAHATTVDSYVSNNCDTMASSDCWTGTNVLIVHYSPISSYSASASFLGNVPSYSGATGAADGIITNYHYVFSGDGAGSGQGVRNNAASVLACSSAANYRVYYSPSYQGHSQYISGDWGCDNGVNLDSTLRNNNASQHWG
ncbi:hypothetical protein ACFRKE_17020 [Kitasatospora indigofera]|uniref:hypothetical protein n=1 Tax=Kitasatospora indigofera TaxID=67307 RepID=UPI0036A858B4